MTDAPHIGLSDETTAAPAAVVPDKAALEGLRQVGRAVEDRRDLCVRPHPGARGDLLDRHSPPDRTGRCTSGTSPPTPTPTSSRASSGCAARRSSTRWAGTTTGCPQSAGCRTTTASGATPPCRTTRLHPTREARPEAAGPDQPAQLRRAVRDAGRAGREDLRVALAHARALGRLVTDYTTIGPKSQKVSQRAFLRNFARGEAYLQEAPTLWDVTFQTAVAQAELEAREHPGHYHRVTFHGAGGPVDRDHPSRADRLCGRAHRPPGRRALPAPLRYDGDLARLRGRDPRARPPRRRARQGRGHRDVLHVRRPHRRHVVA